MFNSFKTHTNNNEYRNMTKADISKFPVNKSHCAYCPFDREGQAWIRERVKRTCLEVSQICCHTQDTLCRGARDYQLTIFYRMGVIRAATDEAWQQAREESGC